MDVELSSFFDMEGALYVVDSFEQIKDVVVHYSYSIEPFLQGRRGEFVVLIVICDACVEAMGT